MTIREQYQQMEAQTLAPGATQSAASRGRRIAEAECEVRTVFQRDRDRIIHSKAFRRLMHKTQVFISPEGDHFRTRLTHTLEVSQIARTIARALRLNEDLTEAIALGHDIGHTPFGHGGERAMQELYPGGFSHNKHSLRVVDQLEKNRAGLNLTFEVRDGILCHTGAERPCTMEGQVVRHSDRIAYVNHDIDDAIRAGFLTLSQLPQDALALLGRTHKERINTLVSSMIHTSAQTGLIGMAPEVEQAMLALRESLFTLVYRSAPALREEEKAKQILSTLYTHLLQYPELLPQEYLAGAKVDGLSRTVCDYIAGMSDRFAISLFSRFTLPAAFAGE